MMLGGVADAALVSEIARFTKAVEEAVVKRQAVQQNIERLEEALSHVRNARDRANETRAKAPTLLAGEDGWRGTSREAFDYGCKSVVGDRAARLEMELACLEGAMINKLAKQRSQLDVIAQIKERAESNIESFKKQLTGQGEQSSSGDGTGGGASTGGGCAGGGSGGGGGLMSGEPSSATAKA